jgi:hypothetical protein
MDQAALCHDFIGCLKEWQDLVAGIIGFGGAVAAIVYTSLSETRTRDTDAKALRQTLGVELRRLSNDALSALIRLNEAMRPKDPTFGEIIHTGDVTDIFRIARPTIYPNVAAKIATIGSNASRVVYFYSRLEECRDRVARLEPKRAVESSELLEILALLRRLLKTALDAREHLEPITDGASKDDTRFRNELERLFPPRA